MPQSERERGNRCPWSSGSALYRAYHDEEWGVPVHDDRKHFEFLILEGAQAGLSWSTILNKREGYRAAYDGFDPVKVAAYNEAKITELLNNPDIVRNRLKVHASVSNARHFLEVQREFGSFDAYIWGFVNNKTIINRFRKMSELPATSPESNALSKDLKKRGFRFVGPTIIYAHMQAIGLVNDHLTSCFRHGELTAVQDH
ncbi:MAG: DNA-3-methyladenine glycosylase I [Mariprofundaceae bacterium]|nr:DNA-3-methyladenine glycosylase I [Mariprofundaceae bacterium]